MKIIFVAVLLILTFTNCKQQASRKEVDNFCNARLEGLNEKLTYVIMTDIFSPPVCSRIYAYPNIAAYEALRPGSKSYESYGGRLNGLGKLPQPTTGQSISYPLAASIAFMDVASNLVFNGDAIVAQQTEFLNQLDSIGVSKELLENSVNFGRQIGEVIVEWSKKDGYKQRTALGGYIINKDSGRWTPTPPDYIDAVENNWGRLRPMTLDSASTFRPGPPIPYSSDKNSQFYKECYRVYTSANAPGAGDSATAWYWDDNPNTSVTDGHITYFIQKNSPPGHWMHIACTVAKKERYDALKTAHILSKTAIALYDAFISCWEAKYHYNYLRPETFINKHIDKDWEPLIQCPAFPEYPSGHSTISASAATVLTKLVGANYAFTDSTEVPYGRPIRNFASFYQASDQASISRFYGGIHFRPSLDTGVQVGKRVGDYVLKKLQ